MLLPAAGGLRQVLGLTSAAAHGALRNLRAADEGGVVIDNQTRRFNVAAQSATGAQFAAFGGSHISFHGAEHRDSARANFAFDLRVFFYNKAAFGIDRAFYFAINYQLSRKLERAGNGNAR